MLLVSHEPITYTYKGCHSPMILKFLFENEDTCYILKDSDRFTINACFRLGCLRIHPFRKSMESLNLQRVTWGYCLHEFIGPIDEQWAQSHGGGPWC